MEACMEGKEGRELMQASADEVREKGIYTSCTVEVEGKKICTRDGGDWCAGPGAGGGGSSGEEGHRRRGGDAPPRHGLACKRGRR
jgi:hypothetical protein